MRKKGYCIKKIEHILEQSGSGTILFLGKFLHISREDIEKFVTKAGYKFSTTYNTEDKTILVVLSSMLNPLEEELSYELYDKKIPDCKLEEFESYFAKSLKPNALLMALKLSNNQDRLISFLKSPAIDDELYLKLLKLYNWGGEDLFDNDSNRDITLTFIKRFFPHRESFNHTDIAHSPASIIDIALITDNSEILDAILKLPNYKINSRGKEKWKPTALHEFVAINPAISNDAKKQLLNLKDNRYNALLALNLALIKDEQLQLLSSGNTQTKINLAKNRNLDREVFAKLLQESEDVVKTLLQQQKIEPNYLEFIKNEQLDFLANNLESEDTVNSLIGKSQELDFKLALNPTLSAENIIKLHKQYKGEIALNLSQNSNTPKDILEEFYKLDKEEITLNLASNPNTPQEILDALCEQNSNRLNRQLAKNPSVRDEYINFFKLDNELLRIMNDNPLMVEKVSVKERI